MSSVSALQQFFTRISDRVTTSSVRSGEFSPREIVEFGDFKIDTENRIVRLRGERLDLTAPEFDVLMFLANHPQRLITTHTLLATSWTERPTQTEFLPTLLSLRKKLDAAGLGKHYLRTEPWVVYRFDPSPST
jgi:DNA-binding response OmpR family regulator